MPAHPNTTSLSFYASCATGLEKLLADEIRALGATSVRTAGAGVSFAGTLEHAYRACLWSRVANRVLMPIAEGPVDLPESLYDLVRETDWSEHLGVDDTLAVDFFTAASTIDHSQYGALKVKDAVVDQFRERFGRRPSVDRDRPSVRINTYLFRNRARLAIDLSGSSLHRRGYRPAGGGAAPLKENLAAALLLAIGWPSLAEAGEAFVDPLCGSGTLVIEAGLIAGHRAPGLLRDYFGFQGWLGHDPALWASLVAEARERARPVRVPLCGFDQDDRAIALARSCGGNAGLQDDLIWRVAELEAGRPTAVPATHRRGLVMSNPPYGERLAADAGFFHRLGQGLSDYAGWQCGLIVALDAPLARARLPLRPLLTVRNGGIDCAFSTGVIPAITARLADSGSPTAGAGVWEKARARRSHGASQAGVDPARASAVPRSVPSVAEPDVAGPAPRVAEHVDVQPFVNRVKKNLRSLKGWRRQQGIKAFRVYDADLPDFSVAIDIYDCEQRHAVVQEYQAPMTINAALAAARLEALMQVLPEVLDVASSRLHLKVRERQGGARQYERQQGDSVIDALVESGVCLEINFSDYLDTGLFLDHRAVRRHVLAQARGKRFLNLFSYTGSVSAAAVVGGARETVSVDLSRHYGDWAKRNLLNNGADPAKHQVIRSDVNQWLDAASNAEPFDLILLDPPTFSNSTSVEDDWNVQRDHVAAIGAAMRLLHPQGLLIFSTNFRRFKLASELASPADGAARYRIEDRSAWSIDRDFARNQRIHRCWFIQHTSRE